MSLVITPWLGKSTTKLQPSPPQSKYWIRIPRSCFHWWSAFPKFHCAFPYQGNKNPYPNIAVLTKWASIHLAPTHNIAWCCVGFSELTLGTRKRGGPTSYSPLWLTASRRVSGNALFSYATNPK